MFDDQVNIGVDDLRLGMFVARLDRPWRETPFLIEGFMIEEEKDLAALRRSCRHVWVDRRRSTSQSIEGIEQFKVRHEPKPEPKAPAPPPLDGLLVAKYAEKMAAQSAQVKEGGLLSRLWDRVRGKGKPPAPVPRPPEMRFAGISRNVPLVIYTDQRSIEEEIGHARESYGVTEQALSQVMQDMTEKGQVSVDSVRGAVSELVESVAVNPDALMWLTRMREQNVRTYTHGVKVAIYMVTLGRHLGFPPDYLNRLGTIGLLLDVGMMRVDNTVLEKPGKLDPEELLQVRRHVEYTLEALSQTSELDGAVVEGIAQHHERADGSGYPKGLKGDQIGMFGRIAGIADCFAALTTNRPYAEPTSVFDAMKTLFGSGGGQFHEPLIEQFVQAIGVFPVGTLVELSTNEVAAVISHNKVRRLQPRVLVLTDADKQALATPRELDLLNEPEDPDAPRVRILRGLPAGAHNIDPRTYFLI